MNESSRLDLPVHGKNCSRKKADLGFSDTQIFTITSRLYLMVKASF